MSEAREQSAHREMHKAVSEVQDARATIQQLRSSLDESEKKCAQLVAELKQANDAKKKLEAKVVNLIRGKKDVSAINAQAVNISLDVFDNALDQVPEVHVMSGVGSINEGLEALASDVLDEAAEVANVHAGEGPSLNPQRQFGREHPLMPILSALARSEVKEANRGLLLDVFLHHVVIKRLHGLFFCGEAATFNINETAIRVINELFNCVSENGAWLHTVFVSV
jgi:uncharacterized phage infection (PIP) family protein YhgE